MFHEGVNEALAHGSRREIESLPECQEADVKVWKPVLWVKARVRHMQRLREGDLVSKILAPPIIAPVDGGYLVGFMGLRVLRDR